MTHSQTNLRRLYSHIQRVSPLRPTHLAQHALDLRVLKVERDAPLALGPPCDSRALLRDQRMRRQQRIQDKDELVRRRPSPRLVLGE